MLLRYGQELRGYALLLCFGTATFHLAGRYAAEPRARTGLALAACTPTVKVEAPKEPITINLNVKADVVVTLKETAREDIQANPGVF